jgi:hypothetical protein
MTVKTKDKTANEPTPNAERTERGVLRWLEMAVVAMAALAVYHFLQASDAVASSGDEAASAIVVVDTKRLVDAKIRLATAAIASGAVMNQEQLTLQGQDFGVNLMRSLKSYRDAGYVVLDRQHALAVPLGRDVTEAVARELGVELEPQPDPLTAPSLQ